MIKPEYTLQWRKRTLTSEVVRRGMVFFLIGIVLMTSLVGCQTGGKSADTRLKLAGSTTVEPVALSAAKEFMAKHPGVEITARGGGSTIGVKGVGYGALQMGMSSRPVKKEELDKWPNLKTTILGRDGVAVVVNRNLYNSGVKQLTLDQIAGIWQGKIKNWKQVGGPDLDIMAYDKEMGRGTRDVFAKVVLGSETAPAPGTIGALGENEAVLSAVSGNQGAVSILSTGWQTGEVVGVAVVDKEGKAIAPTAENVAGGRYPIMRDLVVITSGPPKGLAEDFINYMLSKEGQAFVEKQGYTKIVS